MVIYFVEFAMLSEREKAGFTSMLTQLNAKDVLQLADTVTNRMLAVNNKQEAIKAIITYTDTAKSLLNRRKVTREHIFRYLSTEHVTVLPTWDKVTLMKKVLEFWGSDDTVIVQEDGQEETVLKEPELQNPNRETKDTGQELAKHFVPWFFTMLNSHNTDLNQTPTDTFGPHHFFAECVFKLRIVSSDIQDHTYTGSGLVCQRFLAFVQEEKLIFNPNTDRNGLQGKSEAHGCVLVMVCGTVHRSDQCLGTYEQSFGLVRDPMAENNWKIKFTNLKVQAGQVGQTPPTLPTRDNMFALEAP